MNAGRRSILGRYNDTTVDPDAAAALERDAARLAALGNPLSPVHVITVDVLTDLMSIGEKLSRGGKTPPALRTLMKVLDRSRPLLLEQLAEIPPDQIQEFMRDLITRMQRITDAGEGGHDGSSGPPGSDRPDASVAS